MVAGLQREENRRRRGHAGAEQQRSGPAFERAQQRFGLVEARVVGANVAPARAVLVVLVADVRARKVQRRHDCFRGRIDPAERLRSERLGRELFLLAHSASSGKSRNSASACGFASASVLPTGIPCTTALTASSTTLLFFVRGMSATWMIFAGTWRGVVFERIRARIL